MVNFFKRIPFYPFFLEILKQKSFDEFYFKYSKGSCLEVGCGNMNTKEKILNKNKKIDSYLATDYKVTHCMSGNKDKKVDDYADALNLKYDDETFDTHISLEVLEHMPEPFKFFKEAHRVLKRGGFMIFTAPFLYREHGSQKYHEDYFRFTKNSFPILAKKFGFKCLKIYSNTGIGTTTCVLVNTYMIRKIFESKFFVRIFFFILSPLIFFISNCLGFIFDIKPDDRYAIRYLVILEKI